MNFKTLKVMKTNRFYTAFLSISMILLIAGCDSFLEEDARNFLNPEAFYKSLSDAEGGLAGLYGAINPNLFVRSIHVVNQVNSDESWPWSFTAWDVGYDFTPDDAMPRNAWNVYYEGIKRANSFIQVLEHIDIDYPEELRNKMLGEAKFLRAFFYSFLVQYYGAVPLVEKPVSNKDDFYMERTPEDRVREFIKKDLYSAIASLPEKSAYAGKDISRASKGAAKVLLAKILLIENDWPNAKIIIDEIIASKEYELEEDIRDNWRTNNKHGKESIFEKDFESGYTPTLGHTLFQNSAPLGLRHPVTNQVIGGTQAGSSFSPFFFNSFDDIDTRKQLFFDPSKHTGAKGRYFTNKYFDPNVMFHAANSPVNYVAYRYADVLLMKAEIENELNSGPNNAAYEAINMVRDRANIPDLTANLSYNDFLNKVFEERQKELFYEGHRFLDLKRRGYNFTKERVESARIQLFQFMGFEGGFDVKETELLLPIPTTEMDANPNLIQNPEY